MLAVGPTSVAWIPAELREGMYTASSFKTTSKLLRSMKPTRPSECRYRVGLLTEGI